MKNRFWGKKEDGTYGFTIPPSREPTPGEMAEKIIAGIAKAKEFNRPNHIKDYKEPEPPKPKVAAPVQDPYFDATDPVWLATVKVINAEIHQLRVKNDNPRLTWEETCSLRGEIKRLKLLLQLPERRKKAIDGSSSEKHLKII